LKLQLVVIMKDLDSKGENRWVSGPPISDTEDNREMLRNGARDVANGGAAAFNYLDDDAGGLIYVAVPHHRIMSVQVALVDSE
jgi:hypothetical protein